jgi:hypothetical protein
VDNNYPTESLVHVEYIRGLVHLTHATITRANVTKIGYPHYLHSIVNERFILDGAES